MCARTHTQRQMLKMYEERQPKNDAVTNKIIKDDRKVSNRRKMLQKRKWTIFTDKS